MSDVEEEMNERAEMLADLRAKATGQNPAIDVSYRIGTKELTDEGKVSLALEFATVGDMLKFRDSLIPTGMDEELNIRQIDSLDRIKAERRFILRNTVEESVRVARYVTTEG
jgi:hypothetical protein